MSFERGGCTSLFGAFTEEEEEDAGSRAVEGTAAWAAAASCAAISAALMAAASSAAACSAAAFARASGEFAMFSLTSAMLISPEITF